MRSPRASRLLAALAPLARIYGLAVARRNRHYDRPGAALQCAVPVISVGNLTLGGTGKTPIVGRIAGILLERDLRPAVVSRGYGGSAGRGPILVSTGDGPRCDAAVSGDEPHLLARTLPGLLVVVGSNRVAAAQEAGRRGADVVVLDDGFQHRRLARDLDVVLLDATDPFGNGRLLPAGPLREPLAALGRADLVVLTRCRADDRHPDLVETVRRYNRNAPIVRAGHRPDGFVDSDGNPAARPSRAAAFCGIGRPEGFRADLEAEGIELNGFRAWRDHHVYRARELAALSRQAERAGGVLVTTEKDMARLPADWLGGAGRSVIALRIVPIVHDAVPFETAVLAAVPGARR